MKKSSTVRQSRVTRYFKSYNFLGTIIGAIFVYLSFLPSLLPRGMILQAVVSGVLFLFGYAIGLIVSHFVRKFDPAFLKTKQRPQIKRYIYWGMVVLYIVAAIFGYVWQKEARKLVGESADNSLSLVVITLVGLLLVVFIMLIARSIRTLYGWLKRLISKHIPKPVAYTGAWILTVLIVIGVLNGVILSSVMGALNEAFSIKNGTTDKGIVQPTDMHLSGSPESLIKWDTLGRQGRNFIGRATPTSKLSSFNHETAMQPIRVYSGLESASTTQDRADLAAADLKRAGGLNRKVIVVVTTTGTGWVDEEGVSPVEYMYNGDSAIVSMQYSFLPSWLSFLVDQQKAKDAGSELYNAIYNETLSIPKEERPKVVVFGESLGSYGGETAFANEASFRATSDGAVWAGPPNFNSLRKTATAERDAGSPEILPIFQKGETVRFADKASDLTKPSTPWTYPRAAYLENSSDPIVWWSPALFYQEPDWLKEPRGSDVSPQTHWLPIITFWQVTGDMVFSTAVPDGHGHKYGKLPTDAWSYVAPPAGWNHAKTDALKAQLSH